MITKLSHVNVFVLDQDRALAFYTEKLGFEVRRRHHGRHAPLTVGSKDRPTSRAARRRRRRCSARRTPRCAAWSPGALAGG
jgi:catechol 2,3-dioxygenase-like lactoylglutathione lyase family enzyme